MELPVKAKRKEGYMKKQALKRITMLGLLLILTSVSVAAQSQRSGPTRIPFSFIVGGKTLPAGVYTFGSNRRDYDKVWSVQRRDGDHSALFTTIPVRANETQEKTKIVFHKYGDQYFLAQIWTAGGNSGRALLMPREERELAKRIERDMTIVLVNGSAFKN